MFNRHFCLQDDDPSSIYLGSLSIFTNWLTPVHTIIMFVRLVVNQCSARMIMFDIDILHTTQERIEYNRKKNRIKSKEKEREREREKERGPSNGLYTLSIFNRLSLSIERFIC